MENFTLKEREREHLREVLTKTHWDLEKAAHVLRIPMFQLTQKLKEYGLEHPEPPEFPVIRDTPIDDPVLPG